VKIPNPITNKLITPPLMMIDQESVFILLCL